MFKKQLMEGEELVRRCAATKCYHVLKKWKYTKKLTKFENSVVKFCQMHGLIQVCRDSKEILVVVNEHGKKLDEIHSMLEKCSLRGSIEAKNRSDNSRTESEAA
ncbi:hypothetical protein HAX54_040224 [Datura stramonium]|uniref:RPW8 domain-containing protein n=1 Tax=Datura stramonium TaxID=4076 RepID=A0ABS8SJR9_DATST|nr:hypothetical protein [Datura stramonium]